MAGGLELNEHVVVNGETSAPVGCYNALAILVFHRQDKALDTLRDRHILTPRIYSEARHVIVHSACNHVLFRGCRYAAIGAD